LIEEVKHNQKIIQVKRILEFWVLNHNKNKPGNTSRPLHKLNIELAPYPGFKKMLIHFFTSNLIFQVGWYPYHKVFAHPSLGEGSKFIRDHSVSSFHEEGQLTIPDLYEYFNEEYNHKSPSENGLMSSLQEPFKMSNTQSSLYENELEGKSDFEPKISAINSTGGKIILILK
jgi:hypothetical protein